MEPKQLDFYSFFTKYSLMDEYGFSSGLISRLFRKLLPSFPEEGTVEYWLLTEQDPIPSLLTEVLGDHARARHIAEQLDLSIKALCSKVVTFGLDSSIKSRYQSLGFEAQPFNALVESIHVFDEGTSQDPRVVGQSLDEVKQLIQELRKNRHQMGTNFHLTVTTRRMLDYTERIQQLLKLRGNLGAKEAWTNLFEDYIAYHASKDSIRRFIGRHFDMVAVEIVDHTSQKGEKYIAENRKDYWKFFRRSLLGGSIIAVFALVKLYIDSLQLTDLQNAWWFSLNYALCFIVVKQVGGIIATKQPAMTASTIAERIDAKRDSQSISIASIVVLVRKVARSQFISIVGNFLMAVLFASVLMLIITGLELEALEQAIKPESLIKKVVPSIKLVSFAALAGVFLALSGLISGFIDNKVVEGRVPHRIRNSSLFGRSHRVADYVKKKTGSLMGNVFLGFFLGSAFLVSYLIPLPVDIRHIAFSSAQVGYSMIHGQLAIQTIVWALTGALLIGLINFFVSFAITLYLALKSRGMSLRLLPSIALNIFKDFLRNPLTYLIPSPEKQKTHNS